MRPSDRIIGSIGLAVLAGAVIAGCQGSNLPMPANGPQDQWFSTNNAQIRFVDGAPNAGPAGCAAGTSACSVDVVIDGATVLPLLGNFNPSDNPIGSTIGPYYSFPAGQALIQIFEHGTATPVFEGSVSISAGKKYSFVLAGTGPATPAPTPPAPDFYPAYMFTDTAYQSMPGTTEATFHNASVNAASVTFSATCSACPAGGQPIGTGPLATGKSVNAVNLTPSGGYTFKGVSGANSPTIAVSAIDGKDTGSTLPDPLAPTQPNVSIYAVDTLGSPNFELIGALDPNG
jgi:hypothetical protein